MARSRRVRCKPNAHVAGELKCRHAGQIPENETMWMRIYCFVTDACLLALVACSGGASGTNTTIVVVVTPTPTPTASPNLTILPASSPKSPVVISRSQGTTVSIDPPLGSNAVGIQQWTVGGNYLCTTTSGGRFGDAQVVLSPAFSGRRFNTDMQLQSFSEIALN